MAPESQRKCQIILTASARPNFVKIKPLYQALKAATWCDVSFVFISQHQNQDMSYNMMRDLGMGDPDIIVTVDSAASFGARLGQIVDGFSEVLREQPVDLVICPGDVDGSMGAALATKRCGVKLGHLEAGLRSEDMDMPEEVNRILIDSIADLFLTPDAGSTQRLVAVEGKPVQAVFTVGNIMIDSLVQLMRSPGWADPIPDVTLPRGDFCVATLHRPSNVDSKVRLSRIIDELVRVGEQMPVVLPAHPRLKNNIEGINLEGRFEAGRAPIHMLPPLPYSSFIKLLSRARFVITDSGGVQEECAWMRKRCFTLRPSTERPVTVECGSNHLVDLDSLGPAVADLLAPNSLAPAIEAIPLWDGRTAHRIAHVLQTCWDRGVI